MNLTTATLRLLASIVATIVALTGPVACLAVDVTLQATVAGHTPERIGYNSGHFMPGSNTAAWWKYSGVNAARVWATPSTVEGNDDNAIWGDGVSSEAQFVARRSALRSDPLNTTYINWPYLENRYENNPTTGSNDVNLKYAFGQLHEMGVDSVVEMHRSSEAYPFRTAGTSGGWADRWEQWQHFYAQAFYLAKNFDVRRFQMYNEPNHSSNEVSQDEYIERLRLASDAVQSAVADVNSLYGKSLDVQMHAPVTAGGLSIFGENPGGDPRDDTVGWGELVMQNLHTNYLGQFDPNFKLIDTYAYQLYNRTGPQFGSELTSIKNTVNAAAAGEPMRYAITEFNVHTASVFEGLTETLNSPSKYSTLGSIFSNLANNQPDELYVFKFSQTADDSASGVKKNGVHLVDNGNAPFNIGSSTKGGEVVRLFAKGFAGGHELLTTPAAVGSGATDVHMAAAYDEESGHYSLLAANVATSQRTLSLNLNNWGIAPGTFVTVEEVSADRHGEVRQLVETPASGIIQLTQPAQSVFLVTAPDMPPAQRVTLGATDDAMVKAGGNVAVNFGASPNLYAKHDPTNASARNISFIKFDLGDIAAAGVEQAVLRVFGENDGAGVAGDPNVITHVYGLLGQNADAWSEESITWASAPNLGTTPGIGLVNDISQNFIEGIGATAEIVGHFTGTQSARELMLDVTPFVKEHPDKQITFLIAREVRYDGENVDDAFTSLLLASKENAADAGPQLILSLNDQALTADFDRNGVVDGADFTAWQRGFGEAGGTFEDGDADNDANVDGSDFLAWQRSHGGSLPASLLAASVVPEPAGIALCVGAWLGAIGLKLKPAIAQDR